MASVYDEYVIVPGAMDSAAELVHLGIFDSSNFEDQANSSWVATAVVQIDTGIIVRWISPCWGIASSSGNSCGDAVMSVFLDGRSIWPFHPSYEPGDEAATYPITYAPLRDPSGAGTPFPQIVGVERATPGGVPERLHFADGQTWSLQRTIEPRGFQFETCPQADRVANVGLGNRPVMLDAPAYSPFPAEHAVAVLQDERPSVGDAPIVHTSLTKLTYVTSPILANGGLHNGKLTAIAAWSIFPVMDSAVIKARVDVQYTSEPSGSWKAIDGQVSSWTEAETDVPPFLMAPQTDFGSALQAVEGVTNFTDDPLYGMSHALGFTGEPDTHLMVTGIPAADTPGAVIIRLSDSAVVYAQYPAGASSCRPLHG